MIDSTKGGGVLPYITTENVHGLCPVLSEGDSSVVAVKLEFSARKTGVIDDSKARAVNVNRVAHLMAQLAAESGFKPVKENMAKYTAENLVTLWPDHFTPALAAQVAGNAQAVGDIAYGNRMGNGGPETHEGGLYVGRGLLQLTGKANYAAYSRLTGFDLIGSPDLALEVGVGCAIACAFWMVHGLNKLADQGGVEMVKPITEVVNGGENGLTTRQSYYLKATRLLK